MLLTVGSGLAAIIRSPKVVNSKIFFVPRLQVKGLRKTRTATTTRFKVLKRFCDGIQRSQLVQTDDPCDPPFIVLQAPYVHEF